MWVGTQEPRAACFLLGAYGRFQSPAAVHSGSSPVPPVQCLGVALPHGPGFPRGWKDLDKPDSNPATPRAQHQACSSF